MKPLYRPAFIYKFDLKLRTILTSMSSAGEGKVIICNESQILSWGIIVLHFNPKNIFAEWIQIIGSDMPEYGIFHKKIYSFFQLNFAKTTTLV